MKLRIKQNAVAQCFNLLLIEVGRQRAQKGAELATQPATLIITRISFWYYIDHKLPLILAHWVMAIAFECRGGGTLEAASPKSIF